MGLAYDLGKSTSLPEGTCQGQLLFLPPPRKSVSLPLPPHSPDVNYEELARCTDDFNGAQCKAVCVEAVSVGASCHRPAQAGGGGQGRG